MVGGTQVSRARGGWDHWARRAALASGRNGRHRANICDEPTDYRCQIADVYDLGRSVARAVLVIKHGLQQPILNYTEVLLFAYLQTQN